MNVKEKQALSRILFALVLMILVILRTVKLHREYAINMPYGVMITESLLCVFSIFLFVHTVRFVNEAKVIFKKRKHG